MKLIKGVFLAGLLLVIVAASAFAMYNRGVFDRFSLDQDALIATTIETQIKPRLPAAIAKYIQADTQKTTTSTEATAAANTTEEAQAQLATLGERSKEVGDQVGKVLGEYIQVNEADEKTPLHEKAFEYGQYLYCQQVIKEYEQTQKTSN